MLTRAKRGGRVYLKYPVALLSRKILPRGLNNKALSHSERLVVFLPVVSPILLADIVKFHAYIAVVVIAVVLLVALYQRSDSRHHLCALRIIVYVQRDVRLNIFQPHQLIVNIIPIGIFIGKKAFKIRTVADDKACYAVVCQCACYAIDSL